MIDSDRRQLHKELDDLWRNMIYLIYNYTCEICGEKMTPENCNAHHVIFRVNFNTRYDLENGSLLCNYNHNFAPNAPHYNNRKYLEWFNLHRPEGLYQKLLTKSNEKGGADKLQIMELLNLKKDLQFKLMELQVKRDIARVSQIFIKG